MYTEAELESGELLYLNDVVSFHYIENCNFEFQGRVLEIFKEDAGDEMMCNVNLMIHSNGKGGGGGKKETIKPKEFLKDRIYCYMDTNRVVENIPVRNIVAKVSCCYLNDKLPIKELFLSQFTKKEQRGGIIYYHTASINEGERYVDAIAGEVHLLWRWFNPIEIEVDETTLTPASSLKDVASGFLSLLKRTFFDPFVTSKRSRDSERWNVKTWKWMINKCRQGGEGEGERPKDELFIHEDVIIVILAMLKQWLKMDSSMIDVYEALAHIHRHEVIVNEILKSFEMIEDAVADLEEEEEKKEKKKKKGNKKRSRGGDDSDSDDEEDEDAASIFSSYCDSLSTFSLKDDYSEEEYKKIKKQIEQEEKEEEWSYDSDSSSSSFSTSSTRSTNCSSVRSSFSDNGDGDSSPPSISSSLRAASASENHGDELISVTI